MAANSGKAEKKPRGAGKPFVAGQSGNPSGRRKMPQEFRDIVTKYSIPAIMKIIEVMNDPETSAKDQLTSAGMILDRALGKAIQATEISGPEGNPIETHSLTALSDSELITLEQILSKHTNT